MIIRQLFSDTQLRLRQQPAVVVLGPRQVGKTTLASAIAAEQGGCRVSRHGARGGSGATVPSGSVFSRHRNQLIVIDVVQAMPEIFSALCPVIDTERRPGRFLLLGSASGRLLQQSSESLAGRVAYLELTPFQAHEVGDGAEAVSALWLRGGFPRSYLAEDSAASLTWRADFIQTFLARDLPQLGITIPAETLRRFWRMCAHLQGQLFNASQLGSALGGVAHTTVGRYLDLLVDALVVRRLEPFHINIGKRLVKSPKVYVRDSGLLHALLGIDTLDALSGHPVAGLSWEGFMIEQIIAAAPPLASFGFYRTAAGSELDLVVETGGQRIGYEIKLSAAPKPARGFWNACEDLALTRAYVVAPVLDAFPLANAVEVIPPRMIGDTLS